MPEHVSRRSALALAGGCLAGAALRAAPASAQANSYTLSPDWQVNWRVHKVSSAATVTQVGGGVRVDTGDTAAEVDQTRIALWAKRLQSGNFEFRYTWKVLSRVAVSGGSFGTCYFNTYGEGSTRYPRDVSAWQGIDPDDQLYAAHARGLRFSFATYNPQEPTIDKRLRLRYFNFASPQLVGGQSPADFPFTTGVAYDVRARRVGTKLTVHVTPAAGGTTRSFSWTDSRIGKWTGGYVGFRIRGQDAEITNASLVAV